jgi:hypothetical protein
MGRVALILYLSPGEAQVAINFRMKAVGYFTTTVTVDTGAEVSMFPRKWLQTLDYQVASAHEVEIEQAGIASQSFKATEVTVYIFLEDGQGNRTPEIEITAWFSETEQALLGFAGVLDRAKLFIDLEDTQTGWIDIRDQ